MLVDQNDNGNTVVHFGAWLCCINLVNSVIAAFGTDNFAIVQEHIADILGCNQQPSGVVSEVDDQAFAFFTNRR